METGKITVEVGGEMQISDRAMNQDQKVLDSAAGGDSMRSGRRRLLRKWVLRVVGVILALVVILASVAFLPGRIEGFYQGGGCMCGGRSILRMEAGNVVMYYEDHPPGQWLGRYESAPDGSVSTFLFPANEGGAEEKEPGKVVGHFLFIRSLDPQGKTKGWDFKWPLLGSPKVVEQQEIVCWFVREDRSLVSKFYSSQFEFLREEIKPMRSGNNGRPFH